MGRPFKSFGTPEHVHGTATIRIIDDPETIATISDAPFGKPYLRLTIGETTVAVTTNLAEMIGQTGAGVRERHAKVRGGSDDGPRHRRKT
jgi:hypothetical protein